MVTLMAELDESFPLQNVEIKINIAISPQVNWVETDEYYSSRKKKQKTGGRVKCFSHPWSAIV